MWLLQHMGLTLVTLHHLLLSVMRCYMNKNKTGELMLLPSVSLIFFLFIYDTVYSDLNSML